VLTSRTFQVTCYAFEGHKRYAHLSLLCGLQWMFGVPIQGINDWC
jgi:hypothetical protein